MMMALTRLPLKECLLLLAENCTLAKHFTLIDLLVYTLYASRCFIARFWADTALPCGLDQILDFTQPRFMLGSFPIRFCDGRTWALNVNVKLKGKEVRKGELVQLIERR